MDIHQEIQFGQNEQIPNNKGSCLSDSGNCKGSILDSKGSCLLDSVNCKGSILDSKGSCLLDSENCKGSIMDSKDNVYGNKASGIDVNRNNNVNAPFGSEINESEGGLDHNIENVSGFREKVDGFVQISESVVVDENVRDEDKNFVCGDIVWVMMKTELWWPGFINEPTSKAPKKFIDKDCFQVKLFSSPSSVWASKSQLKEFTCCFDEMVKQDSSRTFVAAVERAVNEISSYVKNELTCSCFQKPCPPKVLELKSFALSRFEPDKFLAFIKGLAIDGVVSQRVQITVTRDCVSAFYRSLGHRQLQVHQLSPNRNSSRKRSRNETGESGKNLKKECVYGSSVADVAKIVKSSSGEMFDDLCWVAVEGSVRKERRYPDLLTRFFSCFRSFAFSENKETEKLKEQRNDKPDKPDKPKGGNATELDSSSVKPKKKRQRKINLNPESVDEGQVGLDETKPEKKKVRKKNVAKTASKIPDLNADVFVPGSFFPFTGQHAMSAVGGFQITGPIAMSSVGGFLVNGQQAMPFGGFPIIGQHAMSSVGYIQFPGHAMAPPSVGGGVQTTTGHAMSSVGGFPIPGHAVPLFGGVQIPGHGMSSVGGVQTTTGHAMPSVGGVQTTTGHAMSSVGGFPVPGPAMPSQTITGHAVSSVGGVQTTTGHAMPSVGGFPIPGHAMPSQIPGVPSTGHAISSNGGGFQINGHGPTVTGENEGNLTNMESAFINNGVGWLDSNGNSMSFLQLLNDVQGGKGFENHNNNNNYFLQNTFPLPPQSSFSRPFESNHINFSSHHQPPQTNPIPTPELKKKRKRKPKEKPPIIINTVTPSSLPDLNGTTTTTTTTESNSNHQPPIKKRNKPTQPPPPPPSRTLLPKNGFKPVTLPSPPGFSGPPPRTASGAPPPQSTPDLAVFMKQKIEMMKSTMEKAGNSLSPEMRGKLENEIRGFTEKYNSMLGSSSSQK